MMVFPELDSEFRILSAADPGAGRGLTIQNLHLSEVSRWPGNASETLAGLRAALAPNGEMVIESRFGAEIALASSLAARQTAAQNN